MDRAGDPHPFEQGAVVGDEEHGATAVRALTEQPEDLPTGFEVDDREPPTGTWTRFGHGWRVLPHEADTDGMVLVRYRRTT